MEKSGFFNARKLPTGEYDRTYLAEDFANFFSKFISNGVYPNPSTGLQVLENGTPDMTVNMQTGYAFINGYTYYNDGVKSFAVDVADGVLNRKDAIFVRWDKVNRQITSVYVKGDSGADPVAPKPLRTADIWDLCVAIISVNAGVTNITQADIEDTRMNKEFCGIVVNVVNEIDTTTLYLQVQKDLESFKNVSYQEFVEWFEQIKGQLSEDAAGNLQIQIDEKGVGTYVHSKSGTVHDFAGDGTNGIAKMTADVEEGDTFTVNGGPVTAWMGVDEAAGAMAGSAYNGRWVSFVFDEMESTLNFKGGGGKITVEGLSADVVLAGNTIKIFQGAKILQTVLGRLDVLAVYGVQGDNGGTMGQAGIVRTASGYSVVGSVSTIPGVPLMAIAGKTSGYATFTMGGNDVVAGTRVYTEFPNKTISFRHNGGAYRYCSAACVVLGYWEE